MRSKQNSLSGTAEVYRFTIGQMVKGKANIFMIIILVLSVLASGPLTALLGGGNKPEKSKITAVHVKNDSGYPLVFETLTEEYFANTCFSDTELTEETFGEQLGDTEVFAQITKDDVQGEFRLDAFTLEGSRIEQSDLDACVNVLSDLFNTARYSQINAGEEQLAILMSSYTTQTKKIAEYLEPENVNVDDRLAVQL